MKICIISNIYPPIIRGGAEIIASSMAKGLKKALNNVFAISSRPHIRKRGLMYSKFITTDEVEDIDVFRFYPPNIYYYLNDYKFPGFIRLIWHIFDIFNIFSYFRVKKILLEEKPDIIISHNLMGLGFLLPILFCKLNIKHVHVLHDVQLAYLSGLIIKGKEKNLEYRVLKLFGYDKLMNKLMGSPNIVISPSKFLLEYYKEKNFFKDSKKYVLPNPILSIKKFKKQSSHDLNLLYLGQINKSKGVIELIKSFSKIKLPHIKLHIVGIGDDLKLAKKISKNDKRIKFYGWLLHNKLSSILSKTDVLVLPSLCYENSPTVIYEALSMGIPILAADIGGSAELIKENNNGWTFEAGDFNAMNKKIKALYLQREKLSSLENNCKNSVKEHLLDKYTEKLVNIINNEK